MMREPDVDSKLNRTKYSRTMLALLTVESQSVDVLRLVADFARGLGCRTDDGEIASGRQIAIEVPAGSDEMLELLSHLALSATKAGVHVDEPLCRVTFRHGEATSIVSLSLRLMAFDMQAAPRT